MTDAAYQAAPKARTLLQSIEAMAEEAGEDGHTLRQIMDRLDERAFGAMLFILALPCCVPFLYLVPQIVSLPMMALAAQMAAGRDEPWLPARLATRKINKAGLASTAEGGRKWFGWVEALARPRLTALTGKAPERVIGAVLCVFCASILLPFPMTNTVPGFAIALASFGLIQRDGLLVLIGVFLGLAWIAFLIGVAIFGLDALVSLVSSAVSAN
ncbi:MAG: exopolysaccharide biosynthesis protein [Pseudomonadota bacterium]